jgi:hypothetical protein
MMFAVYDVESGLIRAFFGMPIIEVAQQLQDGEDFILESDTSFTHVFGEVPERRTPPAPIVDPLLHIRFQRNRLLDDADRIYCNAERWSLMTQGKQVEWTSYKRQLKDFPATCDPQNLAWPPLPDV